MTRTPELPPAGAPYRPGRSAQPAGAVVSRLLLSLAFIGASAVGFRLSLTPAPAGAGPAGSQTLQQVTGLDGAGRARLSLDADWVNLNLSAAALRPELLRGQASLPAGASISRSVSRSGDLIGVGYTERSPGLGGGGPVRLRLDQQGLNLMGGPITGQVVGDWNVKLRQDVPTDLRVRLGSGDANLVLTTANLTGLSVSSTSGNLNANLPLRLGGDARFGTLSGDIQVSRNGPTPSGSPARALEAETRSGQVNLSLAGSAFSRVRASSTSGDLTIRLPDRPDVAATVRTGSGDVRVTVPAALTSGDLNLTSRSGDLRLRLPAGAALRLSVTTSSGEVQVPGNYLKRDATYLSRAALSGGPTLNLNVTTGSGNLTVTEDPK